MMVKKFIITGWFFTILCAPLFTSMVHALESSVNTLNPGLEWKTIETDHFRIHFHTTLESVAKKSAFLAEEIHEDIATALDWTPEDKTELILTDEMDFPNGAATPTPFNATYILVTPPTGPQVFDDYDNWLKVLLTHEYTHIIHIDKGSGVPKWMRNLLGRFVLLFPNSLQPGWIIEGLATYYETDEVVGTGRGQSNLFNMMMRTEVAHGLKPLSQVNLPLRSWPGGTTPYLYGVYFFQFIEQQYGRDTLLRYIESNSRNIVPFRVNTNTLRVFGKDMTDLWSEYQAYLESRYAPQLEAIRATAPVTGDALTQKGFQNGAPHAMPDGSVYYIKNDGYTRPVLVRQHGENEVERIINLHSQAHFDIHENAGILVSQPDICNNHYFYYDLYRVNSDATEIERLTTCARYIFSSWSPDAEQIMAVKMSGGQSSLHLLNTDGELNEILWEGKEDEVIGRIDWSPDGSQIVAAVWRTGRWNLELFDVLTKQWTALTDDGWIQAHPRFTGEGESVVYSADYNDVYNIHVMNLTTSEISTLTHVEGGAFEPSVANGTLYYSGYSEKGYDLYRIENAEPVSVLKLSPPEVQGAKVDKNPADGVNAVNLAAKDYSPWSSLRPRWVFPTVEITSNDGNWIGAITGGNDALRVHSYALGAAYELETDTLSGTAGYIYNDRLLLELSRDADIDLDDNSALQSVRISDEFQMTYGYPFLTHGWHVLLNATVEDQYTDKVATGIPPPIDFKVHLAGIGFEFNTSESFNFSISPSDGRHVRLIAESSNIDIVDTTFTGETLTLDWREYIQLTGEHVLALRSVTGRGTGRPVNFRLGGETSRSSETDTFNVRQYNLRGYDDNLPQLSGRRMQLLTSEWRFPLARIERGWMSPPAGISQLSGRVFYEAGAAWNEGGSADRYYKSAGTELTADINLFYSLGLKVRLGYAHGFDDVLGDDVLYFSAVSSF